MKQILIAALLALTFTLPLGWIIAMMFTPLLWRLEPRLHMELAGHSGPSEWIFYLVWILLYLLLFPLFHCLARTFSSKD